MYRMTVLHDVCIFHPRQDFFCTRALLCQLDPGLTVKHRLGRVGSHVCGFTTHMPEIDHKFVGVHKSTQHRSGSMDHQKFCS